jgi:excisionase family DNA binding protein
MYLNAGIWQSRSLCKRQRAADWSGAMLTRRFLTVKDVADLVQVSEASVRHWIRLKQLRAIDLGREWRVIPRDLEAFMAMHETRGASSLPADAGSDAPAGPMDGPSQPGTSPRRHGRNAANRGASQNKEKRDASA